MSHPTNTVNRRRRGTGTIEPQPDGTFRPRLPASIGRRRLNTYATEEEATAVLDAALAEIATRRAVPIEGMTLVAFGARWLDDREIGGIEDPASDRSRWKVHIETAEFINWPIASIRPIHIREWLAGMLRKSAAPGFGHKSAPKRKLGKTTVKNVLNLLRCCFDAAVEHEIIAENPAAKVHLPKQAAKDKRTFDPWTYLLPEEQDRLFAAPAPDADPDLPDLCAFMAWTGVREGEGYCLELTDVHADGDAPHAVIRFGKRLGSTKGGRIRRVPLFGLALDAARRQLERLAGRPNEHRLLWPTLRGERRAEKKPPRHWRALLRTAGIVAATRHDRRPVRFHDLRHTCASSLVAGWRGRRWSLEEVKEILGHRSITTTERYAHLAESALHAAARETHNAGRSAQDLPSVPATAASKPLESLAPPARVERTTFGLGKLSNSEQLHEVERLRGLILGLSDRGVKILEAIAEGGPGVWRVVQEFLVDVIRTGERVAPDGIGVVSENTSSSTARGQR